MPEVRITIGGRSFDVSCQAGEENALKRAAALLDTQASALVAQIGRITEPRMLLMAGLMLADQVTAQAARIRELEQQLAETETPDATIEVIPEELVSILTRIAERAEGMAARVEGDIRETDAA